MFSLPPIRSLASVFTRSVLVLSLIAPQLIMLDAQAANIAALSISDVTVSEGNERVVATFAVTLTPQEGPPVTVDYSTLSGSAVSNADFFPSSGTLEFRADGDSAAPRPTTQYITVLIAGDGLNELTEAFTVELSNASRATIVDGTGAGTIQDDDPLPALSITGGSSSESSESAASLMISLSSASGRTVSVEYATANGTARSPADFTATNGSAVFGPGQTQQQILVPVTNDITDEEEESFEMTLANPTAATIGVGSATWTITDEDAEPSVSISDVSVFEGDTAATGASFILNLSEDSGRSVEVDYATFDGSAVSPSDFASSSGRLVLPSGQRTQTLTVPLVPDTTFEADETFRVVLSNPSNVSLGDAEGIATILNDDAPPLLDLSDTAVVEGNSGTRSASVTVKMSKIAATPVIVNFSTSDGSATSNDYNPSSGTLAFLPGETTKQITVQIKGDTIDEFDESLFISLSEASGADIADPQGIVTILDDDLPPTLRVNDSSMAEADSDVTMTVGISLSAASGKPVTVGFSTSDGSAVAPDDYTSTSGTLAIAAGSTADSVQVTIKGDNQGEFDETFSFILSNPSNAGFNKSSATLKILNDDPGLSFVVDALTLGFEKEAPNNNRLVFTVRLSPAAPSEVAVTFSTADGTATAPGDYVAQVGRLVFAPGEVQKQVVITMNGDTLRESDLESFSLNLLQAEGADLIDSSASGTIWDDDPLGLLALWDYSASEGFPVLVANTIYRPRRGPLIDDFPHPSDVPVSSTFRAESGEAFAGADFVPTVGDLPIRPGQFTSESFPVQTIADAECEQSEYFRLVFENPVNAVIIDRFWMAWIHENSPTCL